MMNIQFHWYGFIVGLAIVFSIQIIEKKLLKLKISEKEYYSLVVTTLIFGIIGARLWHIFTDYWLYLYNPVSIFYIWSGGLSILGGIVGGVFAIYLKVKKLFWEVLDTIIFGLPFGQSIGRLANYVNQELYGKPTVGIFKIYISPENRLRGYESFEYFHPLFLYEAILTLIFGLGLYYLEKNNLLPKIGSGKIALSYIFYYCVIRFLLDFLRIDRGILYFNYFGINQLVLLVIISMYGIFRIFRIIKRYVI